MPKHPSWYDPQTETSPFLTALAEAGDECCRAESVMPHARRRDSLVFIERIKAAIDDYAECEMGAGDFFYNRPQSIG
jgi:hypothetical protein